MIDLILYVWIAIFVVLLVWFFTLQPKLGRFYLYIKDNFSDLFESCRPSFFLTRYNEQLVFLIFMYKKKYKLVNDQAVISEGDRFRTYILANTYVTLVFFAVTFAVFAIGWSGNL